MIHRAELPQGLSCEGSSWCESLNNNFLSWPAVREHLSSKHEQILSCFTCLEKPDESRISDIRLARKVGGFAFEYWCQAGDLNDINQLVERFDTLLGTFDRADSPDLQHREASERLRRTVLQNAGDVQSQGAAKDIWSLNMQERDALLKTWEGEIPMASILDRIAEVHRRHESAVSRKRGVNDDLDARVLEKGKVFSLSEGIRRLAPRMLAALSQRVVDRAMKKGIFFATTADSVLLYSDRQAGMSTQEASISSIACS